jgi:four helix bundle protein
MNNKEFGLQLERRTKKFAISIITLSAALPNTPEGFVIRNQITKSGTSIGANYREANRSRSKADFYNKIKISESEANETIYWIEIIQELNWTDNLIIEAIYKESNELLAIFTSIAGKLKST